MKNMKVILSILLIVFSLGAFQVGVSAANEIKIYVDSEEQSYSNKAIIQNGSTLVPLRGIFESLGADVQWNQSSQTIDASKGSKKVWLKIGSKDAKVDGNAVKLSVPAQVINGSTLVPIRFISESLGADVQWNQATQTIKISQGSVNADDSIVQVGDKAPDFELVGLDGNTYRLSDFKGKGVFLHFWGTWVEPSKREIPAINRQFDIYKDQGVNLLAINLAESKSTVESFLNDLGVSFPVAIDDTKSLRDVYNIMVLPTTILISPDGTIKNIITGEMSESNITSYMESIKPD